MKFVCLILTVLLSSCLLSCNQDKVAYTGIESSMDRLPSDAAGDIVRAAIERAGGWDAWANKNYFQFYKNISQVDSTGEVIRKIRQLHQYNLEPGFQARLTWTSGDDNLFIINDGTQARKYNNGNWLEDPKSKNEAWNSSYGSHYVVSIPYKLTDPGVTLYYEGIDSTLLGRNLHALKVDYAEGAGSSGGMHKWWYYFEEETYDLAAFYLDYGESQSLTTYESFESVGDMRFHKKRLTYGSNPNREKVILKTIYENEEMKFLDHLSPATFQLK